jgi:hypothetical protein
MLQGQDQNVPSKDQFIDLVFNNLDFWKNVQEDWYNNAFSSAASNTKSKDNHENLLVVVVFDEALRLINEKDPNKSLFRAIMQSLAFAYNNSLLKVCMFGVFMDTTLGAADFPPPKVINDSSAKEFQGSNLFDPYLLPGMKDVRYDPNCVDSRNREGREIAAMILLLKSMDELDAGFGWRNVHDFLANLSLMNKSIKEELDVLIPKASELNFNHFVPWFDKFDPSDISFLLRRRAACIMPRDQDGADLLIPFFIRDEDETKFGAILIQVKNACRPATPKKVGRKLFVSSVFEDWDEEDQSIAFFRAVLELGLSRGNKKNPQSIPMANKVDLLEVSVTLDQTAPREEGEAVFIVTSSNSQEEERYFFSKTKSNTMKEGKVKFLRLRGIAGVPWMDEGTYNDFIELLEGPQALETLSFWTQGVNTAGL